jgi:hypothetical protein
MPDWCPLNDIEDIKTIDHPSLWDRIKIAIRGKK